MAQAKRVVDKSSRRFEGANVASGLWAHGKDLVDFRTMAAGAEDRAPHNRLLHDSNVEGLGASILDSPPPDACPLSIGRRAAHHCHLRALFGQTFKNSSRRKSDRSIAGYDQLAHEMPFGSLSRLKKGKRHETLERVAIPGSPGSISPKVTPGANSFLSPTGWSYACPWWTCRVCTSPESSSTAATATTASSTACAAGVLLLTRAAKVAP